MMNLTKAFNILRHFQLWRLGEEISMLEPKVVTQAIDVVLNNYKEHYTKEDFLNAAKMGEVSMIDAKHIVSLLDEARELNKK
ncbi:MAG: hypothetical protein ACOVNU_04125 [Candidatus Kapaibacteriota bacterium]